MNVGEESLSPQHGLSCINWPAQLAGSLANIRGLRIRTTAGTFSDLLAATGNVERQGASTYSMMGLEVVEAPAQLLPLNTEFTFGDVIARIPELASLFELVFQEKSECFDCIITGEVWAGMPERTTVICHLYNAATRHTPEQFDAMVGLVADDAFASREIIQQDMHQIWRITVKLVQQNARPKTFPPLMLKPLAFGVAHTVSDRTLIWPLQDMYYLATLSRLFMLSYGLGMLARYFPSAWMSGLSLEVGTSCFPLLTKAVDRLQEDFPYAVLRELKRTALPEI